MSTSAKAKAVVVVDPYSSGRYMVQELQQQQWPMIGIQSSQDLAGFWLAQYDPSLFIKSIKHETVEQTVAALSEFDVAAVLPGSEPGVLLAEELQDRLGLIGNGAATKEWRRDKYSMQERLRDVGVRAVHQLQSGDVEEMLAWRERWGRWPVIVKPAMSGGTDGVYWCHCDEDIRTAHGNECGKRNVNGVMNDQLLLQEYLDGPEYIVDCVSHEGRHVVSGIWVYKKNKDRETRGIAYEYAQMIESTGATQEQLIEYTFKVLDSLNLRYGASHSEIIVTADGPCLVETAARMHGAKGPKVIELGTGIGTHELVIDVFLNGARVFNDLHTKSARYTLKKYVFESVFRNDHVEGILAKDIDIPEVRSLPSVRDIFPSIKRGEELKITRDLATAPGIIIQVHPRLETILNDLQTIRDLEATTLYQVEAPSEKVGSPKAIHASPWVMSPKHNKAITSSGSDNSLAMFGFDEDGVDDVQ